MKKFLLILVSFLVVFIVGGVAGADQLILDTINFEDITLESDKLVASRGEIAFLEGRGDYVQWTHYFDFPSDIEVTSGMLTLLLSDDGSDCFEFALGWAEGGSWWIQEVDDAAYEYAVSTSALGDGEFTIFLASVWGDFYIDQSVLSIEYDPITSIGPRGDVSPVPEPATMMLFGAGLVGMAAIGRKKFFRNV